MAGAEYSDFETVTGMLSYLGVGLAAGFVVNAASPTPSGEDSTAALVAHTGVQAGASLLLLQQLMRMSMPRRENWLPPCSDASAIVGLILAQPRLRDALDILLKRLDAAAKEAVGMVPPAVVQPPAATQPAPAE
jgi:hypothetical protein